MYELIFFCYERSFEKGRRRKQRPSVRNETYAYYWRVACAYTLRADEEPVDLDAVVVKIKLLAQRYNNL